MKKKRVFILGAGFSYALANLPLAKDISVEIVNLVNSGELDFAETHKSCFIKLWNYLQDQITEGRESLENTGTILKTDDNSFAIDIEYLMTLLDLNIKKQHIPTGSNMDVHYCVIPYIKGFTSTELEYAKQFIILCLLKIFSIKNYNTSEHEKEIKLFIDFLKNEDNTVITFNYDVFLEQILFENKLWHPEDGYMIGKIPEIYGCDKSIFHEPTKIPVLKLHGSVNWLSNNNEIEILLTDLIHSGEGNDVSNIFKGINIDPYYHPHIKFVYLSNTLIAPTYLKLFNKPSQIVLLKESVKAIQDAEEIFVIGYSLPEADTIANFLFTQASSKAKVNIVNKCTFEHDTIVHQCEVLEFANKLNRNYGILQENLNFYDMGIEKWIEDGFPFIQVSTLYDSKERKDFNESIPTWNEV